MADGPQPVLVYDRIDANRRNTRLLMAVYFALLLPLSGGVAQYVTPQSIFTGGSWVDNLQPVPGEIGAELIATAIVLLAIASAVVFVATFSSSSLLLQHVGARKVGPEEQQDLRRTVENLCIGAGLPLPELYIVQSDVANAFATGYDPKHASLVVTSGLLSLLTPRELTAVVAHELSHIGNYDTRLGTMLAAVVATLRLPWSASVSLLRLGSVVLADMRKAAACRVRDPLPLIWSLLIFALLRITSVISGIIAIGVSLLFADLPVGFRLWRWLGVAMPLYALFGAPFLATRLRRLISQEREFLADADAVLLTRDPDGLALALAKVGRAGWGVLKAGAATAHLYFVDPLPASRSWWDSLYQLHPPIDERIGRVATMGDGIPAEELEAAEQIGREYGERLYVKESRKELPLELRPIEQAPWLAEHAGQPLAVQVAGNDVRPGMTFRLTSTDTSLYQKPDGWSPVIERLPDGSIVTFDRLEENFVRVATDSAFGYVSRGTLATRFQGSASQIPRAAQPEPLTLLPERPDAASQGTDRPSEGHDAPETPLYERPDGWSPILAHLPHDAVLRSVVTEGNFMRVTTGDNTVGYVARGAALAALKPFQ